MNRGRARFNGSMTTTTARRLAPLGLAAVAAALLASLALPATSARADAPAQSCWENTNTGESQCFDASLDPLQQIADATGTTVIAVPTTPGPQTRRVAPAHTDGIASPDTSFVQVILYDGNDFGGASFSYFTTNSSVCNGLIYPIANIDSSFNDRANSFQSFNGCQTTVYADPSFGGSSFGPVVSVTSLGPLNNETSSLLID